MTMTTLGIILVMGVIILALIVFWMVHVTDLNRCFENAIIHIFETHVPKHVTQDASDAMRDCYLDLRFNSLVVQGIVRKSRELAKKEEEKECSQSSED